MARQARVVSVTGVYHIMMRGINRQRIFEDNQDEQKFLELLRQYQKRCGFALYGYCLMGNHVHLLLKEAAHPSIATFNGEDVEAGPGEPIEAVFKRIGVSYAVYFNRKYKRTGHLFQDRFKSEAIDTDEYLLMALRYIHLNPVKAGLCAGPEDYPLSSYREYLGESVQPVIEREFVLGIIPVEQLREYTCLPNEDRFLEVKDAEMPMTDEEARECLLKISGCASAEDFQNMERPKREDCFRRLRSDGANIAQISRITGYSRTVVYQVIRE